VSGWARDDVSAQRGVYSRTEEGAHEQRKYKMVNSN
jgi:hypothetical protein